MPAVYLNLPTGRNQLSIIGQIEILLGGHGIVAQVNKRCIGSANRCTWTGWRLEIINIFLLTIAVLVSKNGFIRKMVDSHSHAAVEVKGASGDLRRSQGRIRRPFDIDVGTTASRNGSQPWESRGIDRA